MDVGGVAGIVCREQSALGDPAVSRDAVTKNVVMMAAGRDVGFAAPERSVIPKVCVNASQIVKEERAARMGVVGRVATATPGLNAGVMGIASTRLLFGLTPHLG